MNLAALVSRVLLAAVVAGLFAFSQPAVDGERLMDRSNVVPNSSALVKSLGDAAEYVLRWKPPADAQGWKKRRPEVERALRKALGLEQLPKRTPLNPRFTAQHDGGDYVVENLTFDSRPGFPVTANLYRPKAPPNAKHPAILSPIGHYLSAGKTASEVQALCIKLARMGFLVLVYDAIGHGERMTPGNIHHEAGYALLPLGETIAGWMVWDSMRAIDYLLSREDVDAERIGVTGNSGGGLNTLLTAALDNRVRAAAVVGFTFEFNNWLKYAGTHCTCTHLPGLFRSMEWFEIAGLIAPRPLMLLQGENDNIFPISGARRAARSTAALYSLLGHPEQIRFGELPGQPHAYTRPYREKAYGWMARHLFGQGSGEAIPEGTVQPLGEQDRQLLCDANGSVIPKAPSVVELVRAKAMEAIAKLPANSPPESRRRWLRTLTAPPEANPHYLAPHSGAKSTVPGGRLERFSFVSEDGQYIPGLLWLPEGSSPQTKTIIIVDDRGKAAVTESAIVQGLLAKKYAVISVDLRGRGETLGHYRPEYDTNFRLVANQILFGQPLAGRRAFDLRRLLDYLSLRRDLRSDNVTVVGLGDDGLVVLLAAGDDARIGRIAVAGYYHSFVSQMRIMKRYSRDEMARAWNSAQFTGHVNSGDDDVDLGSVIPHALETADVPDIAALAAPRKVLFCQARDNRDPGVEALLSRFRQVTGAAGESWLTYKPDRPLDEALLLEWLSAADNP